MNVKNNRRRRESIERIEKAFIELLQTRELNEISVSDLCKICELNRSTFYANYVDLYDLADKVRVHLESEVNHLYLTCTEMKLPGDSTVTIISDYSDIFRRISCFTALILNLAMIISMKSSSTIPNKLNKISIINTLITTWNFSKAD